MPPRPKPKKTTASDPTRNTRSKNKNQSSEIGQANLGGSMGPGLTTSSPVQHGDPPQSGGVLGGAPDGDTPPAQFAPVTAVDKENNPPGGAAPITGQASQVSVPPLHSGGANINVPDTTSAPKSTQLRKKTVNKTKAKQKAKNKPPAAPSQLETPASVQVRAPSQEPGSQAIPPGPVAQGNATRADAQTTANRRPRTATKRAEEMADHALRTNAARVAAKTKQVRRQEARAQNEQLAATVEQDGDSEEMIELKRKLFEIQAERDETQRQLDAFKNAQAPVIRTVVTDKGSIPRPRKVKSLSITELRGLFELSGLEHNDEWNRIREAVRDLSMKCGVHPTPECPDWKSQKPLSLGKLYTAIERAFPVFEKFRSSWATEFLVRESFCAKKAHARSKLNPLSYRSKIKSRIVQKRRQSLLSITEDIDNTDMTMDNDAEQNESGSEVGGDENVPAGDGDSEDDESEEDPMILDD